MRFPAALLALAATTVACSATETVTVSPGACDNPQITVDGSEWWTEDPILLTSPADGEFTIDGDRGTLDLQGQKLDYRRHSDGISAMAPCVILNTGDLMTPDDG